MSFSVEWTERDFQAKEAAELSGVPQDLQRNWRRRGLLEEHGTTARVRFDLFHVCDLKVLGILSEAKISVKFARFMGSQVAAEVMGHIRRNPAACEVIGAELTAAEIERLAQECYGEPMRGRFTMFRMPDVPEGDPRTYCFVAATWDGLMEMAARDGGVSAGLVLDSASIAREIVSAAKRPLITFRLTPKEAGE